MLEPMHQRTALLTALLVVLGAAGPAIGLASAQVTLTVALETPGGSPVGNADLTATWDGGSTNTTTASNGKAFIDVPEGADVTIEVEHPDYIRNSPYEVTDAEEEEVTVTVWEKASATVTVRDAQGEVEDVRVAFRKDGETVTVQRTDADGLVESGVIEAGEYTLRLFEPGYYRKTVTLTVEGETTEEVTIERGSVTVQFRVLDDHFDPPEPIAEATISGETVGTIQTLSDGTQEFSVPVNTEITVGVEKEGYETVTRTISVRESRQQVNITTRKTPRIDIEAANERVVVDESVHVTVTDEYGQPLPDATVFLDGSPVGQPDDAGTIRVPIESAGDHTLYVEFEQLTSEEVTVTGVTTGGSSPTDDANVATPSPGSTDDGSGAFSVGGLNLRSTAIGIAGGLVLAVVLFVVLRFR